MSRYHSYILSARKILDSYDSNQPFSFHLRKFFSSEKKYGSRDRRTISSLCYSYFRAGHALKNSSTEEKILAGYFLCENNGNDLLANLKPEWNEQVSLPVSDKLRRLDIDPAGIFPFPDELPADINTPAFILSFFQQPSLFLRIRPGQKQVVLNKLNQAAISFESLNEHCLKLSNNTVLDDIIRLNEEAVVQDYNSQQVLNFIDEKFLHLLSGNPVKAWDCCAASGGKSILLYDILKGKVELTVSDIRENILFNLQKRFREAGIKSYKKFVGDLTQNSPIPAGESFEVIICDAPCSGSGTWARTPEQLLYFREEQINKYVDKQKKIVSAVIPHLLPGGLLFYITCSVFVKENEELTGYIKEKSSLELLQQKYLEGYDKKADTMFVAVFQNPLFP